MYVCLSVSLLVCIRACVCVCVRGEGDLHLHMPVRAMLSIPSCMFLSACVRGLFQLRGCPSFSIDWRPLSSTQFNNCVEYVFCQSDLFVLYMFMLFRFVVTYSHWCRHCLLFLIWILLLLLLLLLVVISYFDAAFFFFFTPVAISHILGKLSLLFYCIFIASRS